jgi:hypothetical protein
MGSGGSWNPADVIGKPVKKLGRDINQQTIDVGDTIEKAGQDVGKFFDPSDTTGIYFGDFLDELTGETNNTTDITDTAGELPELASGESSKFLSETAAAKRRKRALALGRGFASTIRARRNGVSDTNNLLLNSIYSLGKKILG